MDQNIISDEQLQGIQNEVNKMLLRAMENNEKVSSEASLMTLVGLHVHELFLLKSIYNMIKDSKTYAKCEGNDNDK